MIKDNVLEILEYSKVLEFVARYAHTETGRNFILSQKPLTRKDDILERGQFVSEAKEILINQEEPPFSFIPDLYEVLSKSTIDGAILYKKEILDILNLAVTSRQLKSFFTRCGETTINNKLSQNLFTDRQFENSISNIFTESGEIKDGASKKLKEIRSEINTKSENLRKVINSLLKKFTEQGFTQEEYTTQRDGRFVIPVKAEHKRHIRGFVHSESATGQTVYIEPEETLNLNNEILSLHFAEKREIEKILKEITKLIGIRSFELMQSMRFISFLDMYFAAAKYSIEIKGEFPEFNDKKPFHLIDARHPILMKRIGWHKTIPLNLKFEKSVILITGPNAGGKTVVLKTTGILLAMVYTGFHIPAHIDSNIFVFKNLLLDIGDQQSIEDDLSTFSSHLKNIKSIVDETDEQSLVLIDEIGTGTDPAEGSALAAAVLIKLRDNGAKVLATTHHGNLKIMANETEGFQNSSMEYDTEHLQPTYRFIQGLPGSSYAFEVAGRIGFENSFLDLAKKYLDTDKNKIEDFLVSLEKKTQEVKGKLHSLEIENSKLKGLTTLYEQKINQIEKKKKEIIAQTQAEAESYLKDVNKKIEYSIKNIKEANASNDIIKKEKKIIEEIKKKNEELRKSIHKEEIPQKTEFNVGDFVSVYNTATTGEILEIDKSKNKAVISSGTIKIQVKINQLVPAKKDDFERKREYGLEYMNTYINSRIDLRGKKPEEIEFETVKFIDDAYANGLTQIEILHGKGMGVLKKTVHELLKHHEHVKDYYFAKIEFGGEGVTIVELN